MPALGPSGSPSVWYTLNRAQIKHHHQPSASSKASRGIAINISYISDTNRLLWIYVSCITLKLQLVALTKKSFMKRYCMSYFTMKWNCFHTSAEPKL